jgi:DNA repair ATPase RecN
MDHVRWPTDTFARRRRRRGRTIAAVCLFEGREQLNEIARLLAGEKIPGTALRHARELLAQAGNA